ncbi:hypothetical protein [Nonomuraea dietziae]|uniref:hypothetical protein n=1 Tax=Nonomuraea dietziae TaxID=65515 RepID=UPI0031E157BF
MGARDPGLRLPYIDQVPAPADVIKVLWAIDPFDPEFAAKLDRHIAARGLAARSTDPWLIGYFFDNERGWNADVVKEILLKDATLPAKRAFATYMAGAYGQDLARVNAVLGVTADSFEALAATPIDVAKLPAQDMKGFIRLASKTYYTAVRTAIRKQDPHHLFLGSALVPTWRTSLDWNIGGIDPVGRGVTGRLQRQRRLPVRIRGARQAGAQPRVLLQHHRARPAGDQRLHPLSDDRRARRQVPLLRRGAGSQPGLRRLRLVRLLRPGPSPDGPATARASTSACSTSRTSPTPR